MSNSILSGSAALDSECQNPASESLENQGVQEPKTDLGGKLRFEQINEVTLKLTDGSGVNAWDGYRRGYRTTRAVAGLMGIGNGKWIARYKNRWSKPLSLNKAKTYLMEMVRGIRLGHVPADPHTPTGSSVIVTATSPFAPKGVPPSNPRHPNDGLIHGLLKRGRREAHR